MAGTSAHFLLISPCSVTNDGGSEYFPHSAQKTCRLGSTLVVILNSFSPYNLIIN